MTASKAEQFERFRQGEIKLWIIRTPSPDKESGSVLFRKLDDNFVGLPAWHTHGDAEEFAKRLSGFTHVFIQEISFSELNAEIELFNSVVPVKVKLELF